MTQTDTASSWLDELFPADQSAEIDPDLSHAARIAEVMRPDDPADFTFEGEVTDHGPRSTAKCSCGHPIRYEYTVRHKRSGRQIPIGSTCIASTIPWLQTVGADGLAAALEAAVAKAEADRKEAARLMREAKSSEAVAELSRDYEALRSWYAEARRQARQAGGWVPQFLYGKCPLPATLKPASTAGRTAAGLRRRIATFYKSAAEWLELDAEELRRYQLPALPALTTAGAEAVRKSYALDASKAEKGLDRYPDPSSSGYQWNTARLAAARRRSAAVEVA